MRRALWVPVLLPFLAMAAEAKQFTCPRTGGDLVYGQEADIESVGQMTSGALPTRDIAMNVYESLMTRDEKNNPILDLAASMSESPDHLAYIFQLRPGVVFHNGKTLSAADVAASFDRYARTNDPRSILANVAGWEATAPLTFTIRMKIVQPTFVEWLSSFIAPVLIIPSEYRDVPDKRLIHPIGTGPFQFIEAIPGNQVKLKRYAAYQPNTSFEDRTGLGGYKQVCLNSVTFRIVTEPGARVDGLMAGELHVVEDLPARALPELKKDPNITVLPFPNWWIQVAQPNISAPPTDNPLFRRAVQAALNMDEIMEAASDGHYSLNVGFQFASQPDHSDVGKETYNLKDPVLARSLLAQSNYGGEPVVLLTNKDYPPMYNAALVVQQQLQAIGVNARMKVVNWPTSVRMARAPDTSWNLFFSGWGIQPAAGPLGVMRILAGPGPAYNKDDLDMRAAWNGMNLAPARADRSAAFERMQALALERVYAIPFGSFTKIQGARANVKGFVPFRVPRMANVWFAN